MKRQSVKSSNIVSIGWENDILEIEFFSSTYQYRGVPKAIYETMMKAPSKGKFFHTIIKPKFQMKKLKEEVK